MAKWRRGHRGAGLGWHGWSVFPHEEMENLTMAVGGGACSAYKCQVQEYKLIRTPTTALRSECVKVEEAFGILSRGEECVVAGFDMEHLRQRLAQSGVNVIGGDR